nr:MAG TPA: hypothetical protein [Caudoviricetes sp.]
MSFIFISFVICFVPINHVFEPVSLISSLTPFVNKRLPRSSSLFSFQKIKNLYFLFEKVNDNVSTFTFCLDL